MWWMAAAWADVVTIAEDCPQGAEGAGNHSGPYCTPAPSCAAGEACGAGLECRSTGLCVFEETRACGGMTTPGSSCTYLHVEATAACETDADCDVGSCVVEERCSEPAGILGGSSSEGCGCGTGAAAPAALAGLALVGLWATRAARRRS